MGLTYSKFTFNWGCGIVLKSGETCDTWKDNPVTHLNAHILKLWFGVDGIFYTYPIDKILLLAFYSYYVPFYP
jgi:hypothetical protein